MSKANTIAQAMADRLNAYIEIAGVAAMVVRQKDVANQINERVIKASGAAIIIQFEGFVNPSESGGQQLNVTRSYTVTVFTKPVLQDGAIAGDDVMEFVAKSLHNWEIDEDKTTAAEIYVTDGSVIPDKTFAIHQLTVKALSRL